MWTFGILLVNFLYHLYQNLLKIRGDDMKKYEKFSKEELRKICEESESYREVAQKVGYNPNGGSCIATIRQMMVEYGFDSSHFNGQGHTKNTGRYHTPLEKYLNNEQTITSYRLRNRLFAENIFEKKCSCCGLTEWLGQPIPLELHHIDGNKNNNNLSNLEIRCPNCHYFTNTYKGKNIKTRALG